MQLRWLVVISVLAIGCADNNLFSSLADDSSKQAKLEEAQLALDKGDCQKAINGFEDVFNNDPSNVGVRIDLAAAYMCRAGFNPTALIRSAADFAASEQSAEEFDLFKVVADSAATLIVSCEDEEGDSVSPCWDEDTEKAEVKLTEETPGEGACTLVPFDRDLDAAFNLTIVETIRAVMAVMDFSEYVTDVGASASAIQDLSVDDLALLQDLLSTADQTLSCNNELFPDQTVVPPDVADTLHDLNVGLNDVDCANAPPDDPCHTDPLTAQDVIDYLCSQGVTLEEGVC